MSPWTGEKVPALVELPTWHLKNHYLILAKKITWLRNGRPRTQISHYLSLQSTCSFYQAQGSYLHHHHEPKPPVLQDQFSNNPSPRSFSCSLRRKVSLSRAPAFHNTQGRCSHKLGEKRYLLGTRALGGGVGILHMVFWGSQCSIYPLPQGTAPGPSCLSLFSSGSGIFSVLLILN